MIHLSRSAPPVGGVAVVAEEQRDVVVGLAVAVEFDGDFRIDAGAAVALDVRGGREGEPVSARGRVLRQGTAAAVGVGFTGRVRRPAARFAAVLLMPLKAYGNAGGRFAFDCVQNVRGDCAHASIRFPASIFSNESA